MIPASVTIKITSKLVVETTKEYYMLISQKGILKIWHHITITDSY